MSEQIRLREAKREEYWKKHEEYLVRDIFPNCTIGSPLTKEDEEYFLSDDYRNHMNALCDREVDKAKIVFFEREGTKIGFCSYCTYNSEDGKCFIIDFCIYPEYRKKGYGKACFRQLQKEETEALYYELNLSNEVNESFWKSLGFQYNGFDGYGSILYALIPENDEEKLFCEELRTEDYWQIRNLQNGYKAEIGEGFLSDVQQEQLIHAIGQGKIHFFVAKQRTRVVGMCSVSIIFSTFQCKCSGIFKDFFIEPLFRKKGISKLLSKYVFDWCKQQEIYSLWVGCADNDVKMYQYLGFEIPLGNLLAWSVD